MKRICLLFVLTFFVTSFYAQKVSIFDYDPCSEDVAKSSKKQLQKAFDFFQDHKYQKASLILTDMIKKDQAFASVYFLMGMIGANTDNATMIRKYFPLCENECSEYSHPLLWYYLGIINYSDENYTKAQEDFQHFMSLSEDLEFYDSLRNEAINYLNWSDFLYKSTANPVDFSPKEILYLAEKTNYYEPFISADKKEIYFIREEITMDTVRDSFLASTFLRKEIKSGRATLDTNDYYDRGMVLYSPFNSVAKEGRVSMTADNSLLFFSKQNKSSWDIYYCIRYGDYWSEAKPLNINTEEYDEMQPFVTWDGNSLFFVSNRKGGKGGYDLWLSDRINKEQWSEPRNLGSLINTPFDESFPFLSFDNEVLYFLSNGHKTIGGTDIFYKTFSKDEMPKNLGYPINTEANERNLGIMLDGQTAYTTVKKDKYFSINTFSLPKEAQTTPCLLKNGEVRFEVETEVVLDFFNLTKNKFHHINLSPDNPTFALVTEENSEYYLSFNKLGYMFCSQKIDTKKNDTIIMYVKPLESGQVMLLENVQLNASYTDFLQESYLSVIMPFMNFLSTNARIRVNIYSNEKILKVLEKHLLNKGIRKDRFTLRKSNNSNIFYEIQ